MKDKRKLVGFSFAWNGLKEVVKTERNFRIHLVIALLVVMLSLFLELIYIEWAIIMLVIGLVLVAEAINSVIERMIDYLNPRIHPLAKKIKDIAAGSVLLAAIVAVIVGMIIFLPKFVLLLK